MLVKHTKLMHCIMIAINVISYVIDNKIDIKGIKMKYIQISYYIMFLILHFIFANVLFFNLCLAMDIMFYILTLFTFTSIKVKKNKVIKLRPEQSRETEQEKKFCCLWIIQFLVLPLRFLVLLLRVYNIWEKIYILLSDQF